MFYSYNNIVGYIAVTVVNVDSVVVVDLINWKFNKIKIFC